MRTIKFADFDAHSDPLFKELKVLKIQDFVKLQNCLFVHDFLNNKLPVCFDNYFETLSDVHAKTTKASDLGCLFIPHLELPNSASSPSHENALTIGTFYLFN